MTPLGLARKIAKYIQSRGYVTTFQDNSKHKMKTVAIRVYPDRKSIAAAKAQVGVIGQWKEYSIGAVLVQEKQDYWTPKTATIVWSSDGSELAVSVWEPDEWPGVLSGIMHDVMKGQRL